MAAYSDPVIAQASSAAVAFVARLDLPNNPPEGVVALIHSAFSSGYVTGHRQAADADIAILVEIVNSLSPKVTE